MKYFLSCLVSIIVMTCGRRVENQVSLSADSLIARPGTFVYDLAFLRKHKEVIVLQRGPSKIIVSGKDQARVMTSTSKGENGISYGWINYELIRSGIIPKHINPLGGEDRFWMGPEGGQYSLFFKKGASFDFANWQTPPVMDTESFDLVSYDSTQATFKKSSSLTNYSGFTFGFEIRRQIRLLTAKDIEQEFGLSINNAVAFESRNSITNTSKATWKKASGLVSIWILGMLKASDQTTIIIPTEKTSGASEKITDNYFGTIPASRMAKSDGLLLLKGDGKFRGKVGVSPMVAMNLAGSYDAEKQILTLIKFDLDRDADYVNSKWEIQKEPFLGDVVNAYNDGPLPSEKQMGPFYELESSSPARELQPGDTLTHRHITLHVEGDQSTLNEISRKVLGVSLESLKF